MCPLLCLPALPGWLSWAVCLLLLPAGPPIWLSPASLTVAGMSASDAKDLGEEALEISRLSFPGYPDGLREDA